MVAGTSVRGDTVKAMILAAGKGERLRPHTLLTPKPLIPVNGKPLILYHIERLAQAGIKDIVVNSAWLRQKLETFLGDGSQWGVNITFSAEKKALGTGGGIKKALPLLGKAPFMVISADIMTDYPLEALQKTILKTGILGHLLLITNPYHHPQGDYSLDNGIVTHKKSTLPTLTFASIALLTPELFANCSDSTFSVATAFNNAISAKRLTGEHFTGFHCNVDTPERLKYVQKITQAKQTNKL